MARLAADSVVPATIKRNPLVAALFLGFKISVVESHGFLPTILIVIKEKWV